MEPRDSQSAALHPLCVPVESIPEEGMQLEGSVWAENIELDVPEFKEPAVVKYCIHLYKAGNDIVAEGSFETDAHVPCSKCALHISFPLKGDFRVLFLQSALDNTFDGEDFVEEEVEVYNLFGGQADLRKPLREEILLALPMQPDCGLEGEELCPDGKEALKESSTKMEEGDFNLQFADLKRILSKN